MFKKTSGRVILVYSKDSGFKVKALCRPLKFFLSNLGKTVSWTSYCAQGHCQAETGLGFLVQVKGICKATAYKDIINNIKHLSFSCPQTFGHTVYLKKKKT